MNLAVPLTIRHMKRKTLVIAANTNPSCCYILRWISSSQHERNTTELCRIETKLPFLADQRDKIPLCLKLKFFYSNSIRKVKYNRKLFRIWLLIYSEGISIISNPIPPRLWNVNSFFNLFLIFVLYTWSCVLKSDYFYRERWGFTLSGNISITMYCSWPARNRCKYTFWYYI